MNIQALNAEIRDLTADFIVLPLFSNNLNTRKFAVLDKLLQGILSSEIEEASFKGSAGEILVVSAGSGIKAKKIVLLGLGEKQKYSAEVLRQSAAGLFKGNKVADKIVFDLSEVVLGIGAERASKALSEAMLLAKYEFLKYKEKPALKKKDKETELILVLEEKKDLRPAEAGIKAGMLSSGATLYARDLVNEPASVCVPLHLAEHARNIAAESKGKVKVKIFGREESRAKGMNAFLAVAAGAEEEPYFIHLVYKGQKTSDKKIKRIALVGKGITFDSGGLQIKPGESMATMKLDMAGAAAVLGVFSRLAELAPKMEVHGIIAATENMPGPKAYKPGDIVRAMNGKTIEIGHTDAEGRVTLADALSYAVKLKPDFIIDLATLTGACMVALGEEICGLMSNSNKLAEKIKTSAKEAGEKIWELPLEDGYRQLIKGTHGDVKNSGGTRYGGAITAGLFLEEFVSGVPWAHLDIAGPAWAERETIPYMPLGGTGYGVRTLMEFLKKI